MQPRLFPFLLLLLLSTEGFSQNKFSNLHFQQVDSFARTVKYHNDVTELTNQLTTPYPENIYKVRAIFIWITNNIEYDYKTYANGGDKWNFFSCNGTKATCDAALDKFTNDHITFLLDKKKAVCSGYAQLFKKMCNIAGIQNEMVDGYVKAKPFQIGEKLNVTHAWNVVTLDGVNYCCDATWAAGNCKEDETSGRPIAFIKNYEDYYWLTPFNKFVRNHFPIDNKWVLEPGYTREKFFDAPYFFSNQVSKSMNSCAPDTGVIMVKTGDTLHFKFNYISPVKRIQVTTNNNRNVEVWAATNLSAITDRYQFDYVVKENSLYYIEVLFDSYQAIRYRVRY